MRYREVAPGPGMEGIVHRFWTLEGRADASGEFQRAMPDGRPELIFNLGDPFERRHGGGALERQPHALLVGPTTRAMLLRPTGRVHLVGIRLVPGRWPALLDVEGEALLDRAVALREVSRRWRADLLEPLAEARSGEARVALLEHTLRRVAEIEPRGERRPDARLRRAVDLSYAARGAPSAGRVAEMMGVSPRHLTRLFRQGTGMGPGVLRRVARFQRVLGELERPGAVRWAALAARHGFYDQAHLCREFRRFGGLSPARYLAAVRDLTRHFVEPAAGR